MNFQNELICNLSLLKISKAPKNDSDHNCKYSWMSSDLQTMFSPWNDTQLNIKNKCTPSNKSPPPPHKEKKRNCGAEFSVYSLTLKAKYILIILFFLQHDTLFFVVVFCFYLMLQAKFM